MACSQLQQNCFLPRSLVKFIIKPTFKKSIANIDKRTGVLICPYCWTKLGNKLWGFVTVTDYKFFTTIFSIVVPKSPEEYEEHKMC